MNMKKKKTSIVDSLFGSLTHEVDDIAGSLREMNEKRETENKELKIKLNSLQESETSLKLENQVLKDKALKERQMKGESLNTMQLRELLNLESQVMDVLTRIHKQISVKMQDINREEDKICVICAEEKKEIVFATCGHICVCFRCSLGISECPICRGGIVERIRIQDD